MNSSFRGCTAAARSSQSWVGARGSAVMPRTARARPRPGRSRGRGSRGTCRRPSASGRTGSANMKSRRSGVQPGRVVREFQERSAAHPGRDGEVGQQPDPVRPGVRREPAVPREREFGERPRPRHPGRQDDVGLVDIEGVGVQRGELFGERPGHLAAGDRGSPARRRAMPPARAGPCRPGAPPPTGRRSRRGDGRWRRPRPGPATGSCRRPSASPG